MRSFTEFREASEGDCRSSHTAEAIEGDGSQKRPAVLVTIKSVGRGKFTAAFDGRPLVERATSSVIFAACRGLVALGAPDGPARFRHATSLHAFDAEVASIHAAAKLMVLDRQRSGLRMELWAEADEE